MKDVLLVAIDGSKKSIRAIDYAVELARVSGFTLELLHVQPRVNTHYANKKIGKRQLQEYKEERARTILEEGKERIDDVPVIVKWRQGVTAQEISKEADEIDATGIIMGMNSIKSIKGRLLGSTCYSVLKTATCPVTIVP